MPEELIPPGIRIALRNAVGGSGPYTAGQIHDLFNTYGFTEFDGELPDTGGVRRTIADGYHARIDFNSTRAVRQYLDLVDEVLQNYPEDSAYPNSPGQKLRRGAMERTHREGSKWTFQSAGNRRGDGSGTGRSNPESVDSRTYPYLH